VQLSPAGGMASDTWGGLSAWYPGVEMDAFVVMPNHVHGIVMLIGAGVGADDGDRLSIDGIPASASPRTQGLLTLPQVVQRFKTLTTKVYADRVRAGAWPAFNGRLWQRNYYEHIVRSNEELARVRRYIADNPRRWAEDTENPYAVVHSETGSPTDEGRIS
jgi:putative transposase